MINERDRARFSRTAARLRAATGCPTCHGSGVLRVEGRYPSNVDRFCSDCAATDPYTRAVAEYPGECQRCQQPIRVGDVIVRPGPSGWVHAECQEGVA